MYATGRYPVTITGTFWLYERRSNTPPLTQVQIERTFGELFAGKFHFDDGAGEGYWGGVDDIKIELGDPAKPEGGGR